MQITEMRLGDIHPYEKNPRRNDDAVEAVANSIKEFGFKQPIVVDKDHRIIVGHTRYKAAKKLRLKTVPVLIAEDLSDEQVKAYRIADNSTNALATWDYDLLLGEIQGLNFDMGDFGMELIPTEDKIDFSNLEKYKDQEHTEEYDAFLDKFKEKHTTDDCFTPPAVYEAIKGWVLKRYGIDPSRKIIRPFYPGGDYQRHEYPEGCVVIDNPPFSIASEIIRFYTERGIDFFIFSNHLTAFHPIANPKLNVVIVGAAITYDNGAEVLTSFSTNLGENRVEIRGDLYRAIMEVQPNDAKELARYKFPANIATAALLGRLSKYGMVFGIGNVEYIKRLENGPEIFGGGVVMSDRGAETVTEYSIKADEERMRRVNERRSLENMDRVTMEGDKLVFQLSQKEQQIVKRLNEREGIA